MRTSYWAIKNKFNPITRILAAIGIIAVVALLTITTVAGGTPNLYEEWTDSPGAGYDSVHVAISNNGYYVAAAFSSSTSPSSSQLKLYNKAGDSLGTATLSDVAMGVDISYDGSRILVWGRKYLDVYDNTESGLVRTVQIFPDFPCLSAHLTRGDPQLIVYVVDKGTNRLLYAYNISSESSASADLGSEVIIDLAVANNKVTRNSFIIALGNNTNIIHIYTYSPFGLNNNIEIDVREPGSTGEHGILSIDLTEYGKFLGVLYKNDTGSFVTIYRLDPTTSSYARIGEPVKVDGTPYVLKIQNGEEDTLHMVVGTDRYAQVFSADIISNTTKFVKSFGSSNSYVYEFVDTSYHGSFFVAGTNESGEAILTDLISSSSTTVNQLLDLDLSENGAKLALGDVGSLSNALIRFFDTGVYEDLPVPIPEPAILVPIILATVIGLLVARYLRL